MAAQHAAVPASHRTNQPHALAPAERFALTQATHCNCCVLQGAAAAAAVATGITDEDDANTDAGSLALAGK